MILDLIQTNVGKKPRLCYGNIEPGVINQFIEGVLVCMIILKVRFIDFKYKKLNRFSQELQIISKKETIHRVVFPDD